MVAEADGIARETVAERLARVRARIADAARRVGRDPREITLVAVSKGQPADAVRQAIASGQDLFGENRVQEALAKMAAVGKPAHWHLIGHLQRNKASQAAGRFQLIHSVDSVRLIDELERLAAAAGREQALLLQINVSGEASKSGAPPGELPSLLDRLDASPHLRGEGLMTIPPWSEDPETTRPHFARLRDLLAGIGCRRRFAARHLSMGMSHDFEVAIAEGATLVRVGTAIFGQRV
jgi:PLP dependent protein